MTTPAPDTTEACERYAAAHAEWCTAAATAYNLRRRWHATSVDVILTNGRLATVSREVTRDEINAAEAVERRARAARIEARAAIEPGFGQTVTR